MHGLYKITSDNQKNQNALGKSEKSSVYYHDLFDYPLTFADLIRWNASGNFSVNCQKIPIVCQNGCYFLQGREGLVYKKILRSRVSAKKMEIARKASKTLSLISSIKMVAVTGSLAMENSVDESDIDLMIITKKGMLWTTRLLAYFSLFVLRFSLRRPMDNRQKDKLCLNLWMDESDLIWKRNDRNLYTAHEIAQIVPLVNKDKTYETFLYENRWILKFWPNSVRVTELPRDGVTEECSFLLFVTMYLCNLAIPLIENIAFKIQYLYMQKKITREFITPTRAIFHPQDRGSYILSRLSP
jgi:predicted nucleotidyltransferase